MMLINGVKFFCMLKVCIDKVSGLKFYSSLDYDSYVLCCYFNYC